MTRLLAVTLHGWLVSATFALRVEERDSNTDFVVVVLEREQKLERGRLVGMKGEGMREEWIGRRAGFKLLLLSDRLVNAITQRLLFCGY